MAARRRTNPINAAVNSFIVSQSQPYIGQIRNVNNQMTADANYADASNTALQSELAGIAQRLQGSSAGMLAGAAERAGGDSDSLNRNMDFLQNVFGQWMTNPEAMQRVGQSAGVVGHADNSGVAAELALRNASMQADSAMTSSTAGMRSNEWKLGQRDKARSARNVLLSQLSQIKAQGPLLRRQFQQEAFENKLKQAALDLQRKELDQQNAQFYASQDQARQMAMLNDVLDDGEENKSVKAPVISKYGLGLNADKWDKTIDDIRARWSGWYEQNGSKLGAARSYSKAYNMLRNTGLTRNHAAWIASTMWNRGGLKRSPVGAVNRMLRRSDISRKWRKKIIISIYGRRAWQNLTAGAVNPEQIAGR